MGNDKEVIAVLGAAGFQGGSVARALLAQDNFAVRAVTRNLSPFRRQKLHDLGIDDMVKADLNDVASLTAAFQGCYGVYAVTNYWESQSAEVEQQQLRNVADAAEAAGIKHVVKSTLIDTRQFVPAEDASYPRVGDFIVPFMDGKSETDSYFLDRVPTTLFMPCMYYEDFIYFPTIKPTRESSDGPLRITLPLGDAPKALVSVADIGKFVATLFSDPSTINKRLGVSGDVLTMSEIAAICERVLGEPVGYKADEHQSPLLSPSTPGVSNLWHFFRENAEQYNAAHSLEESRKRVPELQSFEAWLDQNKNSFQALVC